MPGRLSAKIVCLLVATAFVGAFRLNAGGDDSSDASAAPDTLSVRAGDRAAPRRGRAPAAPKAAGARRGARAPGAAPRPATGPSPPHARRAVRHTAAERRRARADGRRPAPTAVPVTPARAAPGGARAEAQADDAEVRRPELRLSGLDPMGALRSKPYGPSSMPSPAALIVGGRADPPRRRGRLDRRRAADRRPGGRAQTSAADRAHRHDRAAACARAGRPTRPCPSCPGSPSCPAPRRSRRWTAAAAGWSSPSCPRAPRASCRRPPRTRCACRWAARSGPPWRASAASDTRRWPCAA